MTCKRCGKKMHKKGKVRQKYQWRCPACNHTFLVSKEEYMNRADPSGEEEQPTEDQHTKQIVKAVERLKLTPDEAKRVLKGLLLPDVSKKRPVIDHPDKHVRFGVISDKHIGHKCFREDIFGHAVATFKEKSVDFVVNVGDTLEGMSGREGHIYELSHRGYSEQMKAFKEQFEKFEGIPVYSIEAQNSHSGWFNSKANAGVNIGEELEKASEPYIFMGYDEVDLQLDSGLTIRLTHPGGGTAYAISYQAQKYIESLSGGKKPHIIIQGHFHKAMYFYYRNIHFFDAGCLQEQTLFMKKKRTPAMLGYWVIDVEYNKTNWCCEVTPKFYPFYE